MSESPGTARTLQVLQLLASSPEPVAAGRLSSQLGIPRASLYRMLSTMAEHGFVLHDAESSRWALGIGAHELSWAYRRHDPLQRMARPLLNRLVDEVGHSGHFTVLQGSDVVYLIEERAPHRPSLVTDVGVRLPAHLTASGLAMLAALTSAQLDALLPSYPLPQRDGRGPATRRELRDLLRETRRLGYALEDQSVTAGLASVALPVLDGVGHPVASVALTYPADDVTLPQRGQLVDAIRRTIVRLQSRMGITPPGASGP